MLSPRGKKELKINQRRILINSIEIGIPAPEQVFILGQRHTSNGKVVGRVRNSKTLNYKSFTPHRDGLFCERIFGPVQSYICACGKQGPLTTSKGTLKFCPRCEVEYTDQRARRYRIGYIGLVSPVTHIWHLKGRPSYLSLFLGKRKKTLATLAYCNNYLVEQAFSKVEVLLSIAEHGVLSYANQHRAIGADFFKNRILKGLKESKVIKGLTLSREQEKYKVWSPETDFIDGPLSNKVGPKHRLPSACSASSGWPLRGLPKSSQDLRSTGTHRASFLRSLRSTKGSATPLPPSSAQVIRGASQKKATLSYTRSHTLPFLPTFICEFHLRDGLLSFFDTFPPAEDIPIPVYCKIPRRYPLRDVHKFMADQAFSKVQVEQSSTKSRTEFDLGLASRNTFLTDQSRADSRSVTNRDSRWLHSVDRAEPASLKFDPKKSVLSPSGQLDCLWPPKTYGRSTGQANRAGGRLLLSEAEHGLKGPRTSFGRNYVPISRFATSNLWLRSNLKSSSRGRLSQTRATLESALAGFANSSFDPQNQRREGGLRRGQGSKYSQFFGWVAVGLTRASASSKYVPVSRFATSMQVVGGSSRLCRPKREVGLINGNEVSHMSTGAVNDKILSLREVFLNILLDRIVTTLIGLTPSLVTSLNRPEPVITKPSVLLGAKPKVVMARRVSSQVTAQGPFLLNRRLSKKGPTKGVALARGAQQDLLVASQPKGEPRSVDNNLGVFARGLDAGTTLRFAVSKRLTGTTFRRASEPKSEASRRHGRVSTQNKSSYSKHKIVSEDFRFKRPKEFWLPVIGESPARLTIRLLFTDGWSDLALISQAWLANSYRLKIGQSHEADRRRDRVHEVRNPRLEYTSSKAHFEDSFSSSRSRVLRSKTNAGAVRFGESIEDWLEYWFDWWLQKCSGVKPAAVAVKSQLPAPVLQNLGFCKGRLYKSRLLQSPHKPLIFGVRADRRRGRATLRKPKKSDSSKQNRRFCLENGFSFAVFSFLQKVATYQDRVLQIFTRATPDSSQLYLVGPLNITFARASLALTYSLAKYYRPFEPNRASVGLLADRTAPSAGSRSWVGPEGANPKKLSTGSPLANLEQHFGELALGWPRKGLPKKGPTKGVALARRAQQDLLVASQPKGEPRIPFDYLRVRKNNTINTNRNGPEPRTRTSYSRLKGFRASEFSVVMAQWPAVASLTKTCSPSEPILSYAEQARTKSVKLFGSSAELITRSNQKEFAEGASAPRSLVGILERTTPPAGTFGPDRLNKSASALGPKGANSAFVQDPFGQSSKGVTKPKTLKGGLPVGEQVSFKQSNYSREARVHFGSLKGPLILLALRSYALGLTDRPGRNVVPVSRFATSYKTPFFSHSQIASIEVQLLELRSNPIGSFLPNNMVLGRFRPLLRLPSAWVRLRRTVLALSAIAGQRPVGPKGLNSASSGWPLRGLPKSSQGQPELRSGKTKLCEAKPNENQIRSAGPKHNIASYLSKHAQRVKWVKREVFSSDRDEGREINRLDLTAPPTGSARSTELRATTASSGTGLWPIRPSVLLEACSDSLVKSRAGALGPFGANSWVRLRRTVLALSASNSATLSKTNRNYVLGPSGPLGWPRRGLPKSFARPSDGNPRATGRRPVFFANRVFLGLSDAKFSGEKNSTRIGDTRVGLLVLSKAEQEAKRETRTSTESILNLDSQVWFPEIVTIFAGRRPVGPKGLEIIGRSRASALSPFLGCLPQPTGERGALAPSANSFGPLRGPKANSWVRLRRTVLALSASNSATLSKTNRNVVPASSDLAPTGLKTPKSIDRPKSSKSTQNSLLGVALGLEVALARWAPSGPTQRLIGTTFRPTASKEADQSDKKQNPNNKNLIFTDTRYAKNYRTDTAIFSESDAPTSKLIEDDISVKGTLPERSYAFMRRGLKNEVEQTTPTAGSSWARKALERYRGVGLRASLTRPRQLNKSASALSPKGANSPFVQAPLELANQAQEGRTKPDVLFCNEDEYGDEEGPLSTIDDEPEMNSFANAKLFGLGSPLANIKPEVLLEQTAPIDGSSPGPEGPRTASYSAQLNKAQPQRLEPNEIAPTSGKVGSDSYMKAQLDLQAIQEVLSYTGGGALRELLRCFDTQAFSVILLNEIKLLREYHKGYFLYEYDQVSRKATLGVTVGRTEGLALPLTRASREFAKVSRTTLDRPLLSEPGRLDKTEGFVRGHRLNKSEAARLGCLDNLRRDFVKPARSSKAKQIEIHNQSKYENDYEELPEEINRFSRAIHRNARRLKIVQLLMRNKRRPEWMLISALPVLPPDLRPILQMSENLIVASDLNTLYQRVIYRNNRQYKLRIVEWSYATSLQRLVQDAVDRLIENGKGGSKPFLTPGGRPLKSLSDTLKGKKGRFRLNLLGKRVDFSGRSVIVVSPHLKIHECGLPREMALELYQYLLIRQMLLKRQVSSVILAKRVIRQQKAFVWDTLRELIYHHPLLLNRAPTLHRLGIQAFQPKLVLGSTILLHPLVCTGFNADFDGDQMGVHLPLCDEARAEAWDLLWSRNNLLSPATGEPILLPSQDMVLGFYHMTALLPSRYANSTAQGAGSARSIARSADKTAPSVGLGFVQVDAGRRPVGLKGLTKPTQITQTRTPVLGPKGSIDIRSYSNSRFARVGKREYAYDKGLRESHFFSPLDVVRSYQNGDLDIHTPIWLQWNGKIENNDSDQTPLEVRINSFGVITQLYPSYKYRKDASSCPWVPVGDQRSCEATPWVRSSEATNRNVVRTRASASWADGSPNKLGTSTATFNLFIRTTPGRVIVNNIFPLSTDRYNSAN